MKLETYEALPINQSPIRLLKRDYLARMDFDLVGFPSGTTVKFKALLPDGQEYEDDDSTHFRVLNGQLTYRVPRDLSESSGSLVSAFFVINDVESSRLLVHITEPNDTRSNDYVSQIDRIMNHVLSDAILINEISTNGSEILGAKTDELIKQITDWTNTTLEKVNTTVSNSLTSIADVRAVIDKEIDSDRNNFTSKMADVQSSIDKANDTMQSLTKTLDATKSEVDKIDVSQVQNDAKSAKDAANAIQSELGNVPTGSTVMDEIGKSQVVTGATVNGKDVDISNKKLQITLPSPDLNGYVKTAALESYAKTADVDAKLSDAKIAKDTVDSIQAKLGNVPAGSTVMDEIGKSQGISDTGWVPISLINGWGGQVSVRLKDGVLYHNGYLDSKGMTDSGVFKYPDSLGDMTILDNFGKFYSSWIAASESSFAYGSISGANREFLCTSEQKGSSRIITLSHLVYKL